MLDQHNSADLIIAGASVRSLAQSAIAVGLRPICVDLFSDFDLRQLIAESELSADQIRLMQSFDQLESALESIDFQIPLVPVGGLEFASRALNRIRAQRSVFAMSSDVIEQLTNSQLIFPHLKEAGYRIPNFYSNGNNGRYDASKNLQTPGYERSRSQISWLKKDSQSSGGQSVIRIDGRQWQQHVESLQPSEYLQEEVEGIPCSATFLAGTYSHMEGTIRSPELLGCSMQVCGESCLNASGFQFCGNAGPVVFSPATESELRGIAACLQQRWCLQGVFGIDFIWNSGNVYVIEINPRLTASHEIIESQESNQCPHILQHCLQFQRAMFSQFVPCVSHSRGQRTQVRLILYSDQTFQLSAEQQQRMQHLCDLTKQRSSQPSRPATVSTASSVWLSDIPEADVTIEAGDPFCSINFSALQVSDLAATWNKLQPQLSFLNIQDLREMVRAIQNQLATLQDHDGAPAALKQP